MLCLLCGGVCLQVSEAFGLPYAGTAMREAASKWSVLAGLGKSDGEMCQVRCTCRLQHVAVSLTRAHCPGSVLVQLAA
jgi:hypothetical protein